MLITYDSVPELTTLGIKAGRGWEGIRAEGGLKDSSFSEWILSETSPTLPATNNAVSFAGQAFAPQPLRRLSPLAFSYLMALAARQAVPPF